MPIFANDFYEIKCSFIKSMVFEADDRSQSVPATIATDSS